MAQPKKKKNLAINTLFFTRLDVEEQTEKLEELLFLHFYTYYFWQDLKWYKIVRNSLRWGSSVAEGEHKWFCSWNLLRGAVLCSQLNVRLQLKTSDYNESEKALYLFESPFQQF